MTMTAEFIVPGVPAPQGSKNQFGGEANPRTKPWRGAVAAAAAERFSEPIKGPVKIEVVFAFPRPRGHYGTGKNAGRVKPTAPDWAESRRCGDLDKLCRAVGDALTGVAILDDSQIVGWLATKIYAPQGSMWLRIREVI